MSKYNVFIVAQDRSEDLINQLNSLSKTNPNFKPLLRPHEYMSEEHKNYLKPILQRENSLLQFNKLKQDLKNNTSDSSVNNETLSAYLKHQGYASFQVKFNNSLITLWKHKNNNLC